MSVIPKEDWPKVREMRARGLTEGQIALKLGCNRYNVAYALNPQRPSKKEGSSFSSRKIRALNAGFPTYYAYMQARKERKNA